MDAQNSFPRFLALDDQRPFISKFGIPGLLLFVAVVMLRSATKPAAIGLALLVGFWAVTEFVIVGLVKPEEKCLYYRRFFRWQRLEYQEITKCGHSVILPLLYLKLNRYIPPFGNLYFVLYSPAGWIWQQPKRDRQTLDYIRLRIGHTAASPTSGAQGLPSETSRLTETTWKGKAIRCGFGFGTGLGIQFLSVLTNGKPLFLIHWPFDLIVGLILLAGILVRRLGQLDSLLALTLGAVIGGALIQLL